MQNGKESLSIISLLSRNISLRYKVDENNIKWHENIFNMKYLYNNLGIQLNRKCQRNNLIYSLEKLIEHKIFIGNINLKQIDLNDIIKLNYKLINKAFTIITDDEFDKIFRYKKQRVDKYNLFNTYLVIKKFADSNTQQSYPSIEYIMNICNVNSNNTILKYIDILIELGLIDCIRGEYYTNIYGEVQKSNNIYYIKN